jgi:hypothetical protein
MKFHVHQGNALESRISTKINRPKTKHKKKEMRRKFLRKPHKNHTQKTNFSRNFLHLQIEEDEDKIKRAKK